MAMPVYASFINQNDLRLLSNLGLDVTKSSRLCGPVSVVNWSQIKSGQTFSIVEASQLILKHTSASQRLIGLTADELKSFFQALNVSRSLRVYQKHELKKIRSHIDFLMIETFDRGLSPGSRGLNARHHIVVVTHFDKHQETIRLLDPEAPDHIVTSGFIYDQFTDDFYIVPRDHNALAMQRQGFYFPVSRILFAFEADELLN